MSFRCIFSGTAISLLALVTLVARLSAQEPGELPPPRAVAPPMLVPAPPPNAPMPPWLPHYDMDIRLDMVQHTACVHQRVTWTNRHARPSSELVFNAHSHYTVPEGKEVGLLAKTLEILRMLPSECISSGDPPLEVTKVTIAGQPLTFHYRDDNATALAVPLPQPVAQGETVVVDIDYVMHLPEKQGRWGHWQGVTFLSNWLPILAFYDDTGWQPTPFVPWHQPFFNESGIFNVRVTLPADQKIACSGSIVAERPLDGGLKQVDIFAPGVRDFALLCSARYAEFTGEACGVKVRCVALPEHEHYARATVKTICEVLPVYSQWFGPYPWPELTFVESYFGWNGNECATLVMIDERAFAMPHMADGYIEYLIAHETCHQWWYNLLGTNGYCETWMDEAFANYFAHRFLDRKYGVKNNDLLHYPGGLEWLPNIKRQTYRMSGLYGTLGRGEETPVVQDMPRFENVVTLFSMCYDKGGKILGMIEDRMGEPAFVDFLHLIYQRYRYQIIRVADFQHELEAYTGKPKEWQEFFHQWLYEKGLCDWSVEDVTLTPLAPDGTPRPHSRMENFLGALHHGADQQPHKVTVLLHQKAEYNEQTVLGICLDGSDHYQVRIPILPQVQSLTLDNPPATVEMLPDNRVRVTVDLPGAPTQIAVDPDQVLVDRDPSNNYWKTPVHFRFAPLYTFLEENSLTTDYDHWNIIAGPWVYGQSYADPWYTRSTMIGARLGAYRTEHFAGGAYAAYRTDFEDVVVGADGLWDHTPFPSTQIGFNVEHRIAQIGDLQPNVNRAVLYGRYVFLYGDSFYLPPAHYLEVFGGYQDNFLQFERHAVQGAERYEDMSTAGIHYSLNYLTPYWDPEGGFKIDATYSGGVVEFCKYQGVNLGTLEASTVKYLPDLSGLAGNGTHLESALRWLSDTRVVGRVYGAAGLPNQGQYFPLGGSSLFRGFDQRERQGSLLWLASLEWRVPLAKRLTWDLCDHVAGIRNIYAAAFYDVGDTYVNGHSYGPVAHALGVGLRVDTAWLGLVERTTLRFDVAHAFESENRVQFWFGITHPF
jgi:hypothetical protein